MGIKEDKGFKAIQTGGPMGGCLPEAYLDLPVDYEALTQAGSMMGSGGLVIMDEDTCMVDIARFFMDFTQDESCGKCTPCREGTFWMMHLTDRIQAGQASMEDVDLLHEVASQVKGKCLCALGDFSTEAVTTGIERFHADFEQRVIAKEQLEALSPTD